MLDFSDPKKTGVSILTSAADNTILNKYFYLFSSDQNKSKPQVKIRAKTETRLSQWVLPPRMARPPPRSVSRTSCRWWARMGSGRSSSSSSPGSRASWSAATISAPASWEPPWTTGATPATSTSWTDSDGTPSRRRNTRYPCELYLYLSFVWWRTNRRQGPLRSTLPARSRMHGIIKPNHGIYFSSILQKWKY